jgi:dTDP-4-dehydrorhamnose reductase
VRILITGAGGLLGGRLSVLLGADHEITALVRTQPAPPGLATLTADLVDAPSVRRVLESVRPDAVIHCAALADVETCEQDPARTRRENEVATRTLAEACADLGTRLIAISTDLVFRGDGAWSTEATAVDPVMEYGRSKRRAEIAALAGSPHSIILRVALICGRGYGPRLSASESIAVRLQRGETVNLFEDEWRTPIDPASVAQAIAALLLRPREGGVFHLGGSERITRVELGERVALTLGLPPRLIRRSPRTSHPGAPRPRDVSLDTGRAREELGWKPRSLEAAVREGRR